MLVRCVFCISFSLRGERPLLHGSLLHGPDATCLSLHVGKVLCHFPVSYMEHIDATNMPMLTSCIAPVKHPTHDASIARGEQVLSLEIDGGCRMEEILQKRADSTLTFIPLPIWRWGSVFKHTIISDESHERINIAP